MPTAYEALRSNISGKIIIVHQQGEDAMLPSYSVRRERPTPQLSMLLKIFYLIYSLFTIIYSLIQRTLPYSKNLWSYTLAIGSWLIASPDKAMSKPTTSAGVSPRITTQAITRAQRTPASFALSASLPFALLAITLAIANTRKS